MLARRRVREPRPQVHTLRHASPRPPVRKHFPGKSVERSEIPTLGTLRNSTFPCQACQMSSRLRGFSFFTPTGIHIPIVAQANSLGSPSPVNPERRKRDSSLYRPVPNTGVGSATVADFFTERNHPPCNTHHPYSFQRGQTFRCLTQVHASLTLASDGVYEWIETCKLLAHKSSFGRGRSVNGPYGLVNDCRRQV